MAQIIFTFAYNTENHEFVHQGNISIGDAIRLLTEFVAKRIEQEKETLQSEQKTGS